MSEAVSKNCAPRSLLGRAAPWLLAAFILGSYLLLVDSPGTTDVPDYWLRWIGLMRQHGIVQGYAVAGSDYLPGTFTLLAAIDRAAAAWHCDLALLLKCVIACAALLGVTVYFCWRKNMVYATALLGALLINSAAHGYLDSFYLPAILGMAWALAERRNFVAGLFLGLALCFKWQPLLVAPFVFAYVLKPWTGFPNLASLRRIAWLLVGVLPAFLIQAAIFGILPLVQSFRVAAAHQALSFQGLNPNWAIQLALYHARGLSGSLFDTPAPPLLALGMKLLFFGVFAAVFIALLVRGRTFRDFLWCAMLGSFAYFTLNIGVHENHLFVTMVFAFCLLGERIPEGVPIAAYCAVANSVNLILFYGLQGRTAVNSANADAAAVWFSIVNFAFFALCVAHTFRELLTRSSDQAHASFEALAAK